MYWTEVLAFFVFEGHAVGYRQDGDHQRQGEQGAKAYHHTTGIAGYTLVYNSHGMWIAAHEPFESKDAAILKETDMAVKDRVQVVSAIANHDESTGVASDPVTAALIIADKTDVRRSRVRAKKRAPSPMARKTTARISRRCSLSSFRSIRSTGAG